MDADNVSKLRTIIGKLKNPPVASVQGERVSLQFGWQGQGPRLDLFPEYGNEFRLTTYFRRPMNREVVTLENVFDLSELETVIKTLSIIYI